MWILGRLEIALQRANLMFGSIAQDEFGANLVFEWFATNLGVTYFILQTFTGHVRQAWRIAIYFSPPSFSRKDRNCVYKIGHELTVLQVERLASASRRVVAALGS